MGLTLTRKQKEAVRIGENILVRLVQVRGKAAKLCIDAPKGERITREGPTFQLPASTKSEEDS